MRRSHAALTSLVAALTVASGAHAFCRKTVCEGVPVPAGCSGTLDENGCSNEGAFLHWPSPCLSYSVHVTGSRTSGIESDVLESQVRAAFDTWSAVVCADGGSPNFFVTTYPRVSCDAVGYRSDGPNQNLWVFRDDDWIRDSDTPALALTTITADTRTGEIFDADVELNSHDNRFTVGDDLVETDLFSIVLHEAGHVLGIGHSPWSTSTMGDAYLESSTDMRTLEADDRHAICAIMPPGQLPERCDPEPRKGFSTQCEFADSGCCSVATGIPPRSEGWPLLTLLGALGIWRARNQLREGELCSSRRWFRRSPRGIRLHH